MFCFFFILDENGVSRSFIPVGPETASTSNTGDSSFNPYLPPPTNQDIRETLKAAETKDLKNIQSQIAANQRLQNIANGNDTSGTANQHQPKTDNQWIELAQQKVPLNS